MVFFWILVGLSWLGGGIAMLTDLFKKKKKNLSDPAVEPPYQRIENKDVADESLNVSSN